MGIHLNKRSVGIARSLAIIGGTGAIVIGATFAASVGTASLTANTFSVGTGGVQIADDNSGSPGTFGTTAAGFDFGSLTEGGTGTTHQHFWLKDNTDAAITLAAAATDVTATNLDQTKVKVHIEKHGTTDEDTATLDALRTGTESVSNPPTVTDTNGVEYDIWVTLDAGALTSGTSATGSFGLDFTGTTAP